MVWYHGTRVPWYVHVKDRPKGGDAGAGARAGPHACEDCARGIVVDIRAADIAVELEP
jgi:hypothetical protein